MGKNSKIEWCHHTWNPWIGCTKVSPACDHCYAEDLMASRMHVVQWGAGQPRKRTSVKNWNDPLRWNNEAARLGVRYRVFCASLADVFDNEVPDDWRRDLFDMIARTPSLDWLLLTKRIGNVRGMVPLPWISQPVQHGPDPTNIYPAGWPENVWLGATICNQSEADRDVPKLLDTPAAKRFLSIEPLLGQVKLSPCWLNLRCGFGDDEDRAMSHCFGCGGLSGYSDRCAWPSQRINWVIVGGESGPQARPMHSEWARSLRDQCAAAGVPFLFKQWGEWGPDWEGAETCICCGKTKFDAINSRGECGHCGVDNWLPASKPLDALRRVGKKAAGRLLDGRTWDEVPA